jgi:hypothetical protein
MTTLRALALLSISALVMAGCGSNSSGNEDGGCNSGDTVACTCSGGATGVETCTNGAFGACACVGADGGADAGMDAGTDGGSDAGADAGLDGGHDAGPDGGNNDGGMDAGGPVASFSSSAIDLGFGGCGLNTSPGSTSLVISNTGTAALTYSAMLASAQAFSISSASSGTIAVGHQASIAITAAPVPASATAGQSISTTLTLATDDPNHAMTSLAVSLTAQGGVLTLNPANTTFGSSNPVDVVAAPIPITLTNTGNEPVSVAFGASSNADFGVTYTGTPASTAIAANGGVLPGLQATFTPTTSGNENATIPLTVTGAVCAGSATTVILSGTGTNGIFGASTSDVYFGDAAGLVPCGSASPAAAQTFTISNTGNSVYHFTTALGGGANSNYAVTASSAQVIANSPVTITVTPTKTIPAVSATTQDLYSDTLTIATDIANDSTHTIALHQTAKGAILSISPGAYAFGNVPSNSTSVNAFTVTNSGNATANVSLASSDTAKFPVTSGAGPTAVLAGASTSASVTFTPGSTPGTYPANLTLSTGANDVVCAPNPGAVAMTGTGLSATVGVSTSALTFGAQGLTPCGTQATAQTVMLTNTGTLGYTFSALLSRGGSSPYTLSNNCNNGSVGANSSCAITVTPQAIPAVSAVTPNLYGDLLTITSNVSGDSPHFVALSQTAQGAIITGEASTLDYGGVASGDYSDYRYVFTNSGNARYDLKTTIAAGSAFSTNLSQQLDPNNERNFIVSFRPTAMGGFSDKLLLAANSNSTYNVLCAPLPYADTSAGTNYVNLVGTGTALKTTQTRTSLDFGVQNCGAASSPLQSAVFNAGALAYTYTAKLGKTGANAIYTIDSTSGTIAPNGEVKINVTSLPVPQTVPAASVAYHSMNDVLTITTNLASDSPHHVFLQKTPGGAVIMASPATVTMPATAVGASTTVNGGFVLSNSGTVNATGLTFTLSDSTDFSAKLQSTSVSAFGRTDTGNITFTPATSGVKPSTFTLTGAGTTPLCQPLPGAINITGTGQ